MRPTVLPEIKAAIPPLRPDERAALKASIEENGVLAPLLTWMRFLTPEQTAEKLGFGPKCKGEGCKYDHEDVPFDELECGDGIWECPDCGWGVYPFEYDQVLLDGHNRLEICEELGSEEYLTTSIDFDLIAEGADGIEEVVLWVREHSIAQRNLSDDQRAVLANEIREDRARIARREQLEQARAAKAERDFRDAVREACSVGAPSTPTERKERVRAQVAREQNVPEAKLRAAQEVKNARPDLLEKVREGSMPLASAKRE
ncbi:MAG TPA: hypothetical protein VM492_03505, partial [Sumerlaeia bacterium]|nr:hypothetical protein [Sumerlaeia bacterium]